VIHYLKHHARSLIFSASMPPSAVATVLACLDVMEREPERRYKLWENAIYLREGLRTLGFDTVTSETPIIPVVTGNMDRTFSSGARSSTRACSPTRCSRRRCRRAPAACAPR
jgi:8-amino-7-oxononanoate synthase